MSTPTSSPGRTIGGRYRLDASVGRGGMGTVWQAFDEVLRRRVAVKEVLLPPGIPADERAMLCERTLREARSAARLTHPSVVRVYDVVEEDDRPWIVMELLDAKSIADLLRDHGPMPPAAVASVGLQVLGALETAHAAGILHRDVKPGNVLVALDGRATLTDFGVARAPGDSALTSTGLLLGSPSYISPERARGGEPTPAADLWGLGATLYAAVEGRAPFERGDPLPTLTAVVGDPPDPMQRAAALTPVLEGLLAKDVARRWDADRTRTGLRAALGPGVPAGGPPTSAPPAQDHDQDQDQDQDYREPLTPVSAAGGHADVPLAAFFTEDRTDAVLSSPRRRSYEQPPQQSVATPPPAAADGGTTTYQPQPWPYAGQPDPTATQQAPALHSPDQRVPSRGARAAPPRRNRAIAAAILVVALVIVAGGAYLLGQAITGDHGTNAAKTGATPSTSTRPSTSSSAQSTAYTGNGYTVRVPQGWTKQTATSGTTDFDDPAGGRFLRFGASGSSASPLTLLTQGEKTFQAQAGTHDYRRVTLTSAQVLGHDGAVWEFTYTDTQGEARHVTYDTFTDNGTAYELYLSTRADQWSDSQGIFAAAAKTFTVTG